MKRKENMLILIPSFILVLLWIAFSIYHNLISSTISETLNVQISKINPSFDLKTMRALKERNPVSPTFTLTTQVVTVSAEQVSSASAQPVLQETQEQASGEGTLGL